MATVKIDKFGGIMPRVAPSLLPDGAATVAHNCRLDSGKLVPLREPSFVDAAEHTVYHENGLGDIGAAESLHCWKHTLRNGVVRTDFLAFPGRVYFAHGNIADDKYDRIFVTGETGISFTTSSGSTKANCPAAYLFERETGSIIRHCICKEPMNAPRCENADAGGESSGVMYSYFFLSWYDKYGYESQASEPSRNKNRGGSTFLDEPLEHDPNGVVKFQPVHVPVEAWGVRMYKTNGGDESAGEQLIRDYGRGELSALSSEFSVRLDDTQAAETMPKIEAPPFDLVDMIFVPGSFYAGRARSMPHTVLFSDVDNPTNWPMAYQYDVRDNVVKLAVTSNSVFALTDGTPYVLSGTAPESMTVASLATPAACVSERSVVVHRNVVYFASNYGLMAIADGANAGSSCQNVTEAYMTPDQWRELNPASCVVGVHRDALHMFFVKADGESVNMRFDLRDGANALTTHNEAARCVVVDDLTGDMYFVRDNE